MKIAFHGAAQTVTGSKHLITLKNGKKVLLDCGMYQGLGDQTDALNRDFGFVASEVDVMILSHAHIDHSGLIPRLVKQGFRGTIFCTPATKDLTNILLMDSAEIQESDMRFLEKKRQGMAPDLLQPLYTLEDAKKAMELFEPKEYGAWYDVTDGVKAMFTDAGHIIGSACVHLRIQEDSKETRITFSGDLGRYRDVILRSPEVFPQADYIIMESTYGNSLHEDIKDTPEMLLDWIRKVCVERKGKLIFPAFSVGRTQEILYALNQLEAQGVLPKIPFYVDSPLSIEATDVVKRFPLYFNRQIQNVLKNDDDPFSFPGLTYIKSVDESKALNFKNGPMVIISASGMADAGRVKHHISNNIENSRNAIVMTGYCEPHSLGGRLLNGVTEVGIFGVEHQVNAEIGQIRSMSAHGDYEDMSQWLACQNPQAIKQLFLVHGEPDVQVAFKQRLIKKGFVDVLIPERHFEIGLA
ncbi:MBL fold metallo-hydrolase [Niabella pedocola]|uniref:MBL fold metallo-hydrolase n=1 Tax=Niabella pedocola TaxID=1752077 RepID=A0ABS8PPQ9_9BACT|nr:MBL fold metallo-hydrolase [Niabella pedocola]MCD2422312.1 MBL fold metallo-hydrolase [Niabella pedocola]